MRKECFIHKWKISDYAGRIDGKIVKFQGENLSFCKELTAWIKWDKYLIRWYELLWYYGYDGSRFNLKDKGVDALLELLNKYIGDKNIIICAKKAEHYATSDKTRFRWFYANFYNISKKDVDILSDDFILDKLKPRINNNT